MRTASSLRFAATGATRRALASPVATAEGSLVAVLVALGGAIALSLALPKVDAALLAPVGLGALFWAWFGLRPRQAFFVGWLAGAVYFGAAFSWFAETAGAYVAPYGFLLVLAPALLEGFAVAVAGALCALAARLARAEFAPLAAAAAFAALEWLRSVGPFGLPFANVSYTQVASPFAPLAAFVGSFGLTFVLCVPAAYVAAALRAPRRRDITRAGGVAILAVLATVAAAWTFWPARTPGAATVRVAAIQGNIPQTVKWERRTFDLANMRYEALTRRAAASHPALILWPETVVTADLNMMPGLVSDLGALARTTHAELVVGSKQITTQGEYNALYAFRPDGGLDSIYRKRLLVPFVESLPVPALLGRLPGASLVSRFSAGTSSGIIVAGGLHVAPLICWESAFDGAAHRAMRDGAQAFAIATDDAWFGSTAGPYQHAQISQMRALETGTWILRAAATGISGIIAPNGRFTAFGALNTVAIVAGVIGAPQTAPYASLGALPIGIALVLLYAALVIRVRAA
jgi:apolipoprotein N-acyltransferase